MNFTKQNFTCAGIDQILTCPSVGIWPSFLFCCGNPWAKTHIGSIGRFPPKPFLPKEVFPGLCQLSFQFLHLSAHGMRASNSSLAWQTQQMRMIANVATTRVQHKNMENAKLADVLAIDGFDCVCTVKQVLDTALSTRLPVPESKKPCGSHALALLLLCLVNVGDSHFANKWRFP